MDSSMLLDKPTVQADYRDILYYGKYRYRARILMDGLQYTYGVSTVKDYLKRLTRLSNNRLANIDLDSMESFIEWRNINVKENKKCIVRVEGNNASVFSNDLELLFTLESIAEPNNVVFNEITETAPMGVKYFERKPKHKFRAYLKSKRVKENFKTEMKEFIQRYKGTGTIIAPSKALREWLSNKRNYYWNFEYCSSHYYIEYDNESTDSLLSLMFGDMIKRRYKLEVRET